MTTTDKIKEQKAKELHDPVHGMEMWKEHMQRQFILMTLLRTTTEFVRVSDYTPTEMKATLLPIQDACDAAIRKIDRFEKFMKTVDKHNGYEKIKEEMSQDRIWDLLSLIDHSWRVSNIEDIVKILKENTVYK